MTASLHHDTLNALRAGKLVGIKRLDLACGLTTFPEEIFDLADSLEILNLSGNQLSNLPDDLTRLKKLKIIFCSDNQFTHLPEVLGEFEQLSMVGFKANNIKHCPSAAISNQLRWLILTDNALEKVPENLGNCQQMQKLMLAGNQLRTLPESLLGCENLELLRISANKFTHLPDWLFSLPRLAWFAFGGNPLTHAQETHVLAYSPLPLVDWNTLNIGKKLGEGASGLIYEATLKEDKNSVLAAKIFKGNVTSDGLPESEMAAWIHASEHPNLSSVCGQLTQHPEKKQGLLMPIISPDFNILAGPPSLTSCTRDIYAESFKLDPQQALSIASDIAKATAHLHAQGLTHGDLYAHNVLVNQQHALLSDFGGASFLPKDKVIAQNLQKIEVRAFGILLEELLECCHKQYDAQDGFKKMQTLAKACNDTDLTRRPTMLDVSKTLYEI